MKKIILSIFTFLFFGWGLNVYAESVAKFNVDIKINEDATVDVVETILYDFGSLERHGMYRTIPVKYKTDKGNNRSIKLSNISVVDANGQPHNFTKSSVGSDMKLRIGDADKYVTGKQTYQIKYTVDGAINYFDDHDELYWNVTGNEWEVGLSDINVDIFAPSIDEAVCFVGYYGSTQKCDHTDSSVNSVQFKHDNISVGEGFTAVIGMPIGLIDKPTFFEKLMWFVLDNWIVAIPFVVLFWMWRRWNKYGKDPKGRGTIVPYYKSPDDLSPAEIGMIVDEKVHSRDVSASIINLAVHNRIHIRKIDNDYIFKKTTDNSYELKAEEKILYDSIFDGNFFSKSIDDKVVETGVRVSDLKNKFYKDFSRISSNVVSTVVRKGYYAKSPAKVRSSYMALGIFVFIGSLFVSPFFGGAFGVALLFASFPIMIFGFFMPRRTKKGAIMREKILGLKLYLEVAEKDRINFHNAPEKTPEHFEALLPYAMALKVEKKWAKQFEDIYNSSPQWYEGSGSFNPAVFANDMSSFSNVASAAMTSQPSSASSGSSGFSGGGSGGGFGGGGGGSW